jgi:hypothetical protein
MGILKGAMVITALALAAPVWAQGGQGYDRGRDVGRDYHHRWDRDDYAPRWRHHGHQYRHRDRARGPYYSNHYYYAPPAYGYGAPAPGVHIVAPNIYIPFR